MGGQAAEWGKCCEGQATGDKMCGCKGQGSNYLLLAALPPLSCAPLPSAPLPLLSLMKKVGGGKKSDP